MECPADCRPAAQTAEDPGELPRHHRTGRALHWLGNRGQEDMYVAV